MSYTERLLAMVVFVCLAGFGLLTQSCQADEDAVAYRTNPAHTAQNTMPDLTLPLQVKWDVNLGGDASYPLIANGEVFVLTPGTLSPGGSHYQLTALNASTGAVVWGPVQLPASDGGFGAAAAYDNGTVFVTQGQTTTEGGLMLAYNANTGALEWSTDYSGQWWYADGPTALNGFVYTQEAGNVSCVRESDGTLMWTTPQLETEMGDLAVTPTALYISGACGDTFELNPASGGITWSLYTGCEGGGGYTAAYYNGQLFIRDYYNGTFPDSDAVLNASTGNIVETLPSQGAVALDDNLLFGIVNGSLAATNLSNWSNTWTVNDAVDAPVTAPTVVNGIVYVATQSGNLSGYDETSGNQVELVNLGETPSATSDASVDIGAGDGLIVVPCGTHLVAVGSQFTLASLTPVRTSVIGSVNVKYTVTLTQAAPALGSVVSLACTNPAVSIPFSVTVLGGTKSAQFTAKTVKVAGPVSGVVSAAFNGLTLNSTITVEPDGIASFTITPSQVVHGANAIGTVTLNYLAPSPGVTVNFSSSLPPVANPEISSITIPEGSKTGTVTINTATVLSDISEKITASVPGSDSKAATINLAP